MTETAVVISGLAAATPIGVAASEITEALYSGRSGIAPITRFAVEGYRSKTAGVIKQFAAEQFIAPAKLRRLDTLSKYSAALAVQALGDAGLELTALNPERVAVVWGTGFGSTDFTDQYFTGLVRHGPAQANPSLFPYTVPNAAASNVSILLGLKGPNTTFSQKEVSGELALVYAVSLLRKDLADVVIVGSGEELCEFLFRAYSQVKALSPRPNHPVEGLRPYDRTRNGIVLGEAVAAITLERGDRVATRGRKAYAAVAGFSLTSASFGLTMYDRVGDSYARSMETALRNSNVQPDQVSWIHGAGNGSEVLDASELNGIRKVFGAAAARVPVSSTKPYIGAMDGFGIPKVVLTCLAMNQGFIPGTITLEEPEDQAINLVRSSVEHRPTTVLLNGFSNGGANVGMVLTAS